LCISLLPLCPPPFLLRPCVLVAVIHFSRACFPFLHQVMFFVREGFLTQFPLSSLDSFSIKRFQNLFPFLSPPFAPSLPYHYTPLSNLLPHFLYFHIIPLPNQLNGCRGGCRLAGVGWGPCSGGPGWAWGVVWGGVGGPGPPRLPPPPPAHSGEVGNNYGLLLFFWFPLFLFPLVLLFSVSLPIYILR